MEKSIGLDGVLKGGIGAVESGICFKFIGEKGLSGGMAVSVIAIKNPGKTDAGRQVEGAHGKRAVEKVIRL